MREEFMVEVIDEYEHSVDADGSFTEREAIRRAKRIAKGGIVADGTGTFPPYRAIVTATDGNTRRLVFDTHLGERPPPTTGALDQKTYTEQAKVLLAKQGVGSAPQRRLNWWLR